MELDRLPSMVIPLPAVTLSSDILIPKANQHIYEPKCICDQNRVKFPSLVFDIWCSQGFQVIACCDLDLWPQNLISTSMNQNPSVTKTGWNSLQWFLRYGIHKVFRMHRLMHSLTDEQTWTQSASSTIYQHWWRHKKTKGRFFNRQSNQIWSPIYWSEIKFDPRSNRQSSLFRFSTYFDAPISWLTICWWPIK